MHKIFEQLKGALSQFIKQRDHLLLLVPCKDVEVALLLKAMRDLDRESGSDLFLLFAEEFQFSEQFVNNVIRRLVEEHRLINEAVSAETSKLPSLPPQLLSAEMSAKSGLEAGFQYGRSLIDLGRGQHCVWGFGPTVIAESYGYLSLLSELLPRPEILPWMRGTRIVARVPADFQLSLCPLANSQRVQVMPLHISPTAQEDELLATADDPKTSMADRMQAEVQLAYVDYGHSRYDIAVARFRKALAFYQWAEIPALEGLVICGLGDVALRQGKQAEAQQWYSCAVVPAAKAGNPILLSTIVAKLAAVAFMENRFADAEQRYSELVTLRRALIDELGIVEALEWQGLSQERQGAYDRAVLCWEESALICKVFEMKDRLPTMTSHLKRAYTALDMRERLETFDAEWAG